MDVTLIRQLQDKNYEKRKSASFVVEGILKDCLSRNETQRLVHILEQLESLATSTNPVWRYGGVMGLAASSIALSTSIPPYLYLIVPPVIASFHEGDIKLRYFACESMYNVAKVAKGEILPYFNELFDALSRLAADPDPAVKNGADLLDRLVKDILTEQASTYVSILHQQSKIGRDKIDETAEGSSQSDVEIDDALLAFDLSRFVPLLRERIYVYDPFTRLFLVSWLQTLDSIPELDLITYLPEFLDGLIRYLGDSGAEVLISVQNLLADFLREICDIAAMERRREEEGRKYLADAEGPNMNRMTVNEAPSTDGTSSDALTPLTSEALSSVRQDLPQSMDEPPLDAADGESEGSSPEAWVNGEYVKVDHAAIIQILISWLSVPELVEPIQVVCLRWISALLQIVPEVTIPFTPHLIPVILACLPHHAPSIHIASEEANGHLFRAVSDLQPPTQPSMSTPVLDQASQPKPQKQSQNDRQNNILSANDPRHRAKPERSSQISSRRPSELDKPSVERLITETEKLGLDNPEVMLDPLDYGTTVTALTLQFLNKNEETRLAALEWLLMLHAKVPEKVLSLDDGTFPALLKTLSDPSDHVVRLDLQLLSQISSKSCNDAYFSYFMTNLVSVFTTDRGLLEQRGTLIVRQLCLHLGPDRIYRTLAEILEKDEDLEFASSMVQNLNLIMITSPELSEFRKRLKNLDSKDGQALFVILYRSFSHNAVATFTLCLLAQAYESACNLLPIFAELDTTLPLLVQIDRLVQLIESPVFTSLRLHLLEPERYPFLYKALYGLLMLLPQSTAFTTLRNRLSAVNTLGYLNTVPKSAFASSSTSNSTSSTSARTTKRPDEIQWSSLLYHFRSVQMKHERLRRQGMLGITGHHGMSEYPEQHALSYNHVAGPSMGSAAASLPRGLVPTRKKSLFGGVSNKGGGSIYDRSVRHRLVSGTESNASGSRAGGMLKGSLQR